MLIFTNYNVTSTRICDLYIIILPYIIQILFIPSKNDFDASKRGIPSMILPFYKKIIYVLFK